ncbi:MAG: asparagine synthase (glutamine-hydrolyzing) [Chloroflexi bacterium]|jgi:asparagine synthase (glutamine-hydrolysing)|nr:asparagine synthase (glutamine-hydrolyzing) [Chloroflexota bacterium]
MCGIAGIYNRVTNRPIDPSILKRMSGSLRHRGPDEEGFHTSGSIGLAHSRLSIIDLSGGIQPIYNEDKTVCVIFNGEIFNYVELREVLQSKGHRFYTHTDTEVIVHLYEEHGKDFLQHLNGQFAISLWDEKRNELMLARDRVGIRPLFYSVLDDGTFLFGSEMKALFCHPDLQAEIDPSGLDQIFTLWVNIPPRTVFKDVKELAPGHFITVSPEKIETRQYWKLQYPDQGAYEDKPLSYYTEQLRELLYDAVTLRLRADVPVASYLSGGLDSSIISTLVKKYHNNDLITFSVAFKDTEFDERSYQMEMVNHLNTDHRIIEANYDTIGKAFSDVVRYAEKPMIRTAPSPLYLLSGLVRQDNIKVVLTGEGADEIFGGYNIFKEDKIRRFWAAKPESKMRPLLLSTLYPYISRDSRASSFWQSFFKKGLTDTANVFYSHLLRWGNTSHIKRFFTNQYRELFDEDQLFQDLHQYTDPDIRRWHPLCRAQYLEMSLFMSGYLLSSQGDRMMMGHSVEGRFPFLDHRVVEFANTLPPKYKINSLNEKYILKQTYKDLLPNSITERAKQPYRAPISQCFVATPESIDSSLLSRESIEEFGYFDPKKVEILLNKATGKNLGERDEMSLVGIVSTQLLHHHFIKSPKNICDPI